jgi:hypothetical protein
MNALDATLQLMLTLMEGCVLWSLPRVLWLLPVQEISVTTCGVLHAGSMWRLTY